MEKTMIQIRTDTRDKIKSLGKMGETYDDVLQRMYFEIVENSFAKQLLDLSNSKTIDEIMKERNLL